jgi:GTP pyrophosphokinase
LVKTGRAKTRIRQFLRQEERERSLKLGQEICDRELKKYDVNLRGLLKSGHLRLLLKELRCATLDDMLVRVGNGTITIPHLLRTLQPEEFREAEERRRMAEMVERAQRAARDGKGQPSKRGVLDIDGVDGMLVRISQCCHPVPGDAIIGFITTGSGISIHKAECVNLQATDPTRWIEVAWTASPQNTHRAALLIHAENRKSLIADISGSVSADDADIVELNARKTMDNMAELDMVVEVVDLKHLQLLQQHILQLPAVVEVRRR